jgi:hypothetical protein
VQTNSGLCRWHRTVSQHCRPVHSGVIRDIVHRWSNFKFAHIRVNTRAGNYGNHLVRPRPLALCHRPKTKEKRLVSPFHIYEQPSKIGRFWDTGRDVLPSSLVSSTRPADSIFKVEDAGLFLFIFIYVFFSYPHSFSQRNFTVIPSYIFLRAPTGPSWLSAPVLFYKFSLHSSWFQPSVAVSMRPLFFWDVTKRRLLVTDVYERPIGPILKGQAWLLKTGPRGCSETSTTNHNTRRVTFQKNEGFTILSQWRSDKLVLSKRRCLFTNYLGQFQKTAVLRVTAGID